MRLWIGGSSGLTRTYLNAFPTESWILLGRESTAPSWMYPSQHYIRCDLVELNDQPSGTVTKDFSTLPHVLKEIHNCLVVTNSTSIHEIVIGIRPFLVSYRSHESAQFYNDKLLTGLKILLQALISQYPIYLMVNISSIAAVDHIPMQRLRSVDEMDPSSQSLRYPYDRFKRGCEELLEQLVNSPAASIGSSRVQYTNLRLGIQCSALALQCYTGPYLCTPIDCNSSRNVSQLLHLILLQFNHDTIPCNSYPLRLRPVYYYTRCISQYPKPVPYGEFFLAYRNVYGLAKLPVLLPYVLVKYGVVMVFHFWTILLRSMLPSYIMPPFLESIDYLLQVTVHEHTFDMNETLQDFPMIVHLEETMEDCFRRRRAVLQQQSMSCHSTKLNKSQIE
jgi:hypothetical protein